MRNLLCCLIIVLFPLTALAVDRTEAQRYYDLGMSYLMSELYEQGLETLNQVAFLYPESDVADDALYQLALIREDVGDGKIVIAKLQSLELEIGLIERASKRSAAIAEISAKRDIGIEAGLMLSLAATFADIMDRAKTDTIEQIITTPTKRQAIAQYTMAIDYLTILIERYPESDRMEEVNNAIERISGKIESLLSQPIPPKTDEKIAAGIFALDIKKYKEALSVSMRIDWKNNPGLVEKGLTHWLELMNRKLEGESISIVPSLNDFYRKIGYKLTKGQILGLIHPKSGAFCRYLRDKYNIIDFNVNFWHWQEKGLDRFLEVKQTLEAKLKYVQQEAIKEPKESSTATQKMPEVERNLTKTERTWGLVSVAGIREHFPPPGEKIIVYDDEGRKYVAKMHSSCARIDGLTEWYKKHPTAGIGDTVVITINQDKSIRLSLKKEMKYEQSEKTQEDRLEEEPVEEKTTAEIGHDELILHLLELGEINGFQADTEYSCDAYRLDAVWLAKYSDVPKYCFEVHISGSLHKDIAALKHAYDKWNSKIFLICIGEDLEKCKMLISGSFHEIVNRIKILDTKEFFEYCQFKEKFKEINGLFG